jgi:hypothetical protein
MATNNDELVEANLAGLAHNEGYILIKVRPDASEPNHQFILLDLAIDLVDLVDLTEAPFSSLEEISLYLQEQIAGTLDGRINDWFGTSENE